ncbi:DUF3817 domain-containing protein [Streptomyces sp. URMC 126]|uniref:DUF3817 domain-containing protein n=1 Tax=Streptomyces sp. URMC 126 TaxID=3423401 RepID=UPI003F1CB203
MHAKRRRYQALSYISGTLLLALCVAMVFKYGFDTAQGMTLALAQIHGIGYIVYLLCTFDYGTKAGWPIGRLTAVLLAGTIPTAAFYAERRIAHQAEPHPGA